MHDGRILRKYDEAVNLAFQNVLDAPNFGINTPRTSVLKAMSEVLEHMPERDWNFERVVVGWEWVSGLICCLTVGTVTTTWSLRTNETLMCF